MSRHYENRTNAPTNVANAAAGVIGSQRSASVYTRGQVLLSTFFGGPMAGAILMSINATNDKEDDSIAHLVIGLALTILSIGSALLLPEAFTKLVPLAVLFALGVWQRSTQEERSAKILKADGTHGSVALQVLITVLSGVVTVALAYASLSFISL